ncbi:hypothetical protein POG77_04515 [Lactococcus petauri]|nr:hypothetical protein [Lactococcus petauri]MDC0815509.1 hypothetical protein [Lactococcus petauri]MDC0817551.1 hypothetical protein [Lactococcus petauri]MDC0823727.1 hypothetical protein [Lactococcus petauri]MDC0830216.1 hypothetical protein [Lactococcus petauri]
MEKETYRRSSGKKATQKKGKFPKVIGITLLVLILVFTGLGDSSIKVLKQPSIRLILCIWQKHVR